VGERVDVIADLFYAQLVEDGQPLPPSGYETSFGGNALVAQQDVDIVLMPYGGGEPIEVCR
jgi:hypothetical protein